MVKIYRKTSTDYSFPDTLKLLKEYFSYDPSTGVLTRLKVGNRGLSKLVGLPAGTSMYGYLQVSIKGIRYLAHRVAWSLYYGTDPGWLDHINGDRSDNRIENLREVPKSVNAANKSYSTSATGFLGVTLAKGKYQSAIQYKGKNYYLGRYTTPEEAHEAYKSKREQLHQEGSWAL